MPQSLARTEMVKRVYEVAIQDDRIVGLVDFGSGGQGRVDEWSDIDVAVILRDEDYPAFLQDWIKWVNQFGGILLVNKHNAGSPWTIYAAEPVPLRVDFVFYAESDIFMGHRLCALPGTIARIESYVCRESSMNGSVSQGSVAIKV